MTEFGDFDPAQILEELYGLKADLTSLPSEYDRNFLAETSAGNRFILKAMRPGLDPAMVDLQCMALDHLGKRDPSIALPRVRPTLGGRYADTIRDGAGAEHIVWMLTFVPGRLLAETNPHTPKLLYSLGALLGRFDTALSDFTHPAAERELKWDLTRAGWIGDYLGHVEDPDKRALVDNILAMYESDVVPALPSLRTGVVHNDANDYNVLVDPDERNHSREAISVIDFGDMIHTATVSEAAIAAAYALLGKGDPLAAAKHVVAGYHGACPLEPAEVAVLFPLICTRLAVSVVNSAYRKKEKPGDPYVTVTEDQAWSALEKLAAIHPRFAHYTFRDACGLPPVPHAGAVVSWLQSDRVEVAPVLDVDLGTIPSIVVDLGVGSALLGANPKSTDRELLTDIVFGAMHAAGVDIGVGRYDEVRPVYTSPIFATEGSTVDERRTVHLGIDLFAEAGSLIYAPLAGRVHCVANNAEPQDYGPLVILQHTTGDGVGFYSLYGHMSEDTLDEVSPGDEVTSGQRIGRVGAPPINGDWPPHLHFQVITDLLDMNAGFPGVAFASQRDVWQSLSPDPNVLLGVPADRFPPREAAAGEVSERRRGAVGPNLSLSYRKPLEIVRGWMQYLYDETGRAYLDFYNNVPHIGHSHPRVVDAVQRQVALLNTNTRYLHENIVRYAERLTSTLPDPLGVCYFVNSGSEANELALRLARSHIGLRDTIVLEAAYHGHTTTLIDISPYKFDGPGGEGPRPWVHVAPLADDYRGPYKREDPEAGRKYAGHVGEIVERLRGAGGGPAAFICESCPSVGGQIMFPPGYLTEAYQYVRGAGGVCIADEVQTGFGRLGTHFWGFETQDAAPDVVVLGKPIGNGFPLSAVITTPEIAASFDNGMEFFSTFGGNPVSCAAGMAVLEEVLQKNLQGHALRVGERLLAGLEDLKNRHAIVGDVRGSGLFVGVELVLDSTTLEPAAEEASYVVNRLRESGVLTGTDGPYDNVIKIRGPMAVTEDDVDLFVEILDSVLEEDPVRR
jgi:4-aminobutyrate aminotransferase-like enzyme/Ser/Thr protein kinase RdoA (MazF antagonist)